MFRIQGQVTIYNLKISASKQNLPCKRDGYFPIAGFLPSAHLENESYSTVIVILSECLAKPTSFQMLKQVHKNLQIHGQQAWKVVSLDKIWLLGHLEFLLSILKFSHKGTV